MFRFTSFLAVLVVFRWCWRGHGRRLHPPILDSRRGCPYLLGRHGLVHSNLLHSFDATSTNGEEPYGSLIQDGSTLYGMTYLGGANDEGTIFHIGTNGSGFQLLHSFHDTDDTNGENPFGSLIQNGSTLYGTTLLGGAG